MALTNSQYDAVMRLYNQRQISDQRALAERRHDAYLHIPRLQELDSKAAGLSVDKAYALLEPGDHRDFDLSKALADISEERRLLLQSHGYPDDYLDMQYVCPACRDTGYIGRKKCRCFRQLELQVLYAQSNLPDSLQNDTFENFSLDYYDPSRISPQTGADARQEAENALRISRSFVRNFHEKFENICFYGEVGVGKTFLSHCIAGALLNRGFSVLYLTAGDMFDMLRKYKFSGSGSTEELQEFYSLLFSSDLLIIDDLGTELTNAFVSSELFTCINERILRRTPTILSTNLSVREFADTFSERTASRILGNYTLVHMSGHDIRIQKKLAGGQ